jgi:hypothetical protein
MKRATLLGGPFSAANPANLFQPFAEVRFSKPTGLSSAVLAGLEMVMGALTRIVKPNSLSILWGQIKVVP